MPLSERKILVTALFPVAKKERKKKNFTFSGDEYRELNEEKTTPILLSKYSLKR